MKLISFKYTKDNNVASQRVVLVTGEPTEFVTGTDISELEGVDKVLYVNEIKNARQIYLDMVAQINEEFDVTKNFRKFKPSKMSDIVEI